MNDYQGSEADKAVTYPHEARDCQPERCGATSDPRDPILARANPFTHVAPNVFRHNWSDEAVRQSTHWVTWGPNAEVPVTLSQQDQLDLDLLLWGNAYTVDGERVDPTTVEVHRRTPQGEAKQVPAFKIHSQEEFLTALDILLDHTLHGEDCYLDPSDTVCQCVIGKVRAVLPPCGMQMTADGLTDNPKLWTCHRTAHPSSPDRHVFG